MENVTSYSFTKLLDPSAKKHPRVKVISSKVQPLHRPRRSRSQTVNRTGHKTGKGIITETKPTTAPRKNTVRFQESRIPDKVLTETEQWQPSSSTGQPSSEMRPRRSRTPVAQDSATLKPNVDRRPSQAIEVIVPRQRSGTHRSQLNTERTTKCPRIPDMVQTETEQWQPSSSTGQPSSEMRPRRSRAPVAQDSATLKPNVDRRPSQATEVTVPRQRSGIHRSQLNTERTTKCPSLPVKKEHMSSGRGAVRSHTALCTTNKESRTLVPVAFQTRPTKERPLTSCAVPEERQGLNHPKPQQVTSRASPKDLNALRAPLLKFFKEKVSLSQEDKSRASEAVKGLLSTILDKIRGNDATFGLKQLNTGSYYEKLRVCRPVEFDVMLVFDAHRIMRFFDEQYSRDHPGYAKLVFKDHVSGGRELWGQFLTRDGKFLSPTQLVGRFYTLVRDAVKAMTEAERRRVSRIIPNWPAVTLRIDGAIDVDLVLSVEVLKWPSCASGWGDFATNRTWPTKRDVEQIKIKEPKFHLVPKPFPSKSGASNDSHPYWRISFSEAEKTLLKTGSPDKKFYKITKAICLAKKRDLEPLTSFQLKNLFLHNRSEHPRAKHDDTNLGESVVKFFQSLIHRLEQGSLPHFFVSRANLFAEVSQGERMNVARELRGYLCELVQTPNRFLESLNL